MRIIKPGVEIITPVDGESVLKHIELCGRVCYKSEDKIAEGSAEKFVSDLIKRGHEAVLEHAIFIFQMRPSAYENLKFAVWDLQELGYKIYLRYTADGRYVVSGNARAWRDFFKYCLYEYGGIPSYFCDFLLGNPILFPEYQGRKLKGNITADAVTQIGKEALSRGIERLVHYDITCTFTCDRGVSHEIVRHRDAGYCQESTRYCNYGKDGFGNEITVIEPCYLVKNSPRWHMWRTSCETAEEYYMTMLETGCTPQETRAVLPNSLKTELVMTANLREWRHFLRLRTSKAAHPQMREVALMLAREMREKIPVVFEDLAVQDA